MRLQLALRDAPLATPDHEPHLLYPYFAHHALAVRVQVGRCREVAVGLDASVEELAQEPYNAERRPYDLRHGSPLVPGDANENEMKQNKQKPPEMQQRNRAQMLGLI